MKIVGLFLTLLISVSAFAGQTVLTEDTDIMQFLIKNPQAQATPVAAMLAFGSIVKVTSISYGECTQTTAGNVLQLTIKVVGSGAMSSAELGATINCPK
jgi:hypothetical protein